MKTLKVALAVLILGTAVAPVFGEEPQPAEKAPAQKAAALRTAAGHLAINSQNTKGAPRQLMQMESKRLGTLADRLDAGESVDPAEIDRALERAEHGQF